MLLSPRNSRTSPIALPFGRSVIFLILLVAGLEIQAQSSAHCFPIWHGFSQTWGYNHRINRLGDYVKSWPEGDSCSLQIVNAGASGSGADQAKFKEYYTVIRAAEIETYEGSLTLNFAGKEGAYLVDSAYMDIEMPSANDPAIDYEVLLNGFDLQTANGAKADKLHSIDLEVDSVWREPSRRRVWFRIRSGIRFSCSSAECEPLNQVVDYALEVHYIVIGGPGFHSVRSSFGGGLNWEKKDLEAQPLLARVALLGDSRYPEATAGIRGLHLQLDGEHHMLRWDSRIHPNQYADGLLTVDLCLDFTQNNPAMWTNYEERYQGHPKLPAKWVVKAEKGSLAWAMDVSLLQFEAAQIQDASREGQIKWNTSPSKQSSAEGDAAENAGRIQY